MCIRDSNKTDLFQAERRQKESRRCGRRVVEALQLTRFAAAEIVPVAAKISATDKRKDLRHPEVSSSDVSSSTVAVSQPGQAQGAPDAQEKHVPHASASALGIEALKNALLKNVPQLKRDTKLPFLFMADHCFQIKGHGTVLSGAVLLLDDIVSMHSSRAAAADYQAYGHWASLEFPSCMHAVRRTMLPLGSAKR